MAWEDLNGLDREEEYRKAHQTGSRSLYFAQCSDENETWLPLLEKAYAKAHGDYASIDGGFTGEAIEDLTGGVTTEIYSTDILDRDAFWAKELMQVGKQFLFGCATGFYSNWLDTSNGPRERDGISEGHAYSIMDAREINGHRLLKLRNPWGRKEWTGRWSDGSSEWTPEWMQLLDHKFGNDGIFWISYDDLLKKYQHFDRTRIFGPEWNVTQCWTNVDVAWAAQYHSTKFSLTLTERARVVIVLAQLDDAYIGGLDGGYGYDLHFRLESSVKEDENDYIVRSNGNYAMARSVSTDVELEAGTYFVLMKITATRKADQDHLEDVLPFYAATRREKLIQMGLSYDLAHAKGLIVESKQERQERKAQQRSQRAKLREKRKEKARKEALKQWGRNRDRHIRDKQRVRKKQRAEASRRLQGIHATGSLERDGDFENRSSTNYAPRRTITLSTTQTHHANGHEEPHRPISESHMLRDPPLPLRSRDALMEDDEVATTRARVQVAHIQWFDGDRVTIERESGPTYVTAPQSPGFDREDGSQRHSAVVAPNNVIQGSVAAKATQIQTTNPSDSSADQSQGSRGESEDPMPSLNASDGGETDDGSLKRTARVNGIDMTVELKPLFRSPAHSQPGRIHPEPLPWNQEFGDKLDDFRQFREPRHADSLDTTAAVQGLGIPSISDDYKEMPNNLNRSTLQGDGEVSDVDSFPSFDWDGRLDMSSEEASSDSEASPKGESFFRGFVHRRHHRRSSGREGGDRHVPLPMHSSPSPGTPIPLFVDHVNGPEEPWNAVCVVGMRVYSTLPDDGVTLKVVRPKLTSEEDDIEDNYNNIGDLGFGGEQAWGEEDLKESLITLDPDDMARGAMATTPKDTSQRVKGHN